MEIFIDDDSGSGFEGFKLDLRELGDNSEASVE